MGDDDNKIGPLPDRAGDIPGANGHRTYGHGGMRAAKSSLDGGGGTGFGDRPIAVGGDPDASHLGRSAALAYPVTTASAPFANHLGMGVWPVSVSLNSEDVYRFLNRLRGDLIWLAKRIASPVAFMVGVIVGLIESLWDLVKGVYELAKLIRTLILALMYAIEKTAKDYHWSKPAGYSLELFVKIELLLSTAGALSSFTLGTDDEKREAYELVQAIIGEVGKLFKGNLWDKLCAFLGKKGDEVSDAWHKFEALVNSGEPGQEYEAGEMAGKVAGEVIMTIFAFLAIARKIGLVARLARVFGLVGASEAELMAAIEALEAAQASTGNRELEAAIKELRAAIEEVKAAKETGRAAKAAADRLRAATKRLTDTTKAIEDQLAKDAANLKKAAEQVEEKTPKKEGGAENGADTSGSEPTGKQQTPSEPKEPGKTGISKELYQKLRGKTPTKAIQDMVNKDKLPIPRPDPALPGLDITGRLQADHIVPMKTITEMPGFSELNQENMLKVLNNPENFVGLSDTANSSKGALSFDDWTMYKKLGIPVDPTFRAEMIAKEQELIPKLQGQIQDLLSSQAGGGQ